MLDLFGRAAKAELRAVKEALAQERERTAELTRQIIAFADTKVYRAVSVSASVKPPENANLESKPAIRTPMQRPNPAAFMQKSMEGFAEAEKKSAGN